MSLIKSVDSEYRDLGIRTMGIQYKSFQLRSKDIVVGYIDLVEICLLDLSLNIPYTYSAR